MRHKYDHYVDDGVEPLKGLTFSRVTHIEIDSLGDKADGLEFETTDGRIFRLYHRQDCCEGSWLAEIIGDLDDLVDTPILEATTTTHTTDEYPPYEGYTDVEQGWTFYHLRTIKGSVTLRWYGCSNGCYAIDARLYEYK